MIFYRDSARVHVKVKRIFREEKSDLCAARRRAGLDGLLRLQLVRCREFTGKLPGFLSWVYPRFSVFFFSSDAICFVLVSLLLRFISSLQLFFFLRRNG